MLDDWTRAPKFTPIKDDVRSVRSAVEALQGQSGNLLDKALTLRDLLQGGMVSLKLGAEVLGQGNGLSVGTGGASFSGDMPAVDFFGNPTLVTPPTPTNLRASGTYKHVILTWDLDAYANHAYTEVWRATSNNLGTATLIGTAVGNIYADEASITLGTTYYYWVRAVGTTPSTTPGPYNAGVSGGTAGGAGKLGTVDLGPLIVEAANLAAAAVTSTKLAVNAIAIGTAAIQNGAINNAMMGNASIDSAQIVDLAVLTAKIAAAAITTAKIGSAQITQALMANASIGSAQIQNLAVGNAHINDLDAGKINVGTLNAARIGAASIDATKLNVTQLSAVTGTIGTLRTASTGARIEIKDNLIEVFYASGNVAVRITS
jgi:hypothetical protein